MAVGTQFMALVDMLREDLGKSTNVGVGVDDLPSLKRAINRSYAILTDKYRWDHLTYKPPRISLNAGQRVYDFPANLKLNDLAEVVVWQGATAIPLDRGISHPEYAIFNSDDGVRGDPPQKWDLMFNGTATQIEIWPIPASNGNKLALTGNYHLPALINDSDLCRLDDELVVLGAAARHLERQGSKDAKTAKEEFAQRLSDMQKRGGPGMRVSMNGAGDSPQSRRNLLIVGR